MEWEKSVPENFRNSPQFAFVEDNPDLPRVLLIGDSISIGYTLPVREFLGGAANVHRIPVNGRDTRAGVESLSSWLGKRRWDVVHFNFGLHDLKRLNEKGRLDATRPVQVPIDEYEANLESIVTALKAAGPKLIFALTTPVPEGAGGRQSGDAALYNETARGVMNRHGVTINDLHAGVLPCLSEYQKPKNVHFTREGSRFLGKKVAESIRLALDAK